MQCYPRAFGPRATLHYFKAKFFSVDLGTSQYLYNVELGRTILAHSVCSLTVTVRLRNKGLRQISDNIFRVRIRVLHSLNVRHI